MWLGGVGPDVVGGALGRGFLSVMIVMSVMGFTHPQLNFANLIRQ